MAVRRTRPWGAGQIAVLKRYRYTGMEPDDSPVSATTELGITRCGWEDGPVAIPRPSSTAPTSFPM